MAHPCYCKLQLDPRIKVLYRRYRTWYRYDIFGKIWVSNIMNFLSKILTGDFLTVGSTRARGLEVLGHGGWYLADYTLRP
jgi:hypothetical protein